MTDSGTNEVGTDTAAPPPEMSTDADGADTGKSGTPKPPDWEKRHRDVQAAYTKVSQENARLQGRLEALEMQTARADNPPDRFETAEEYEKRIDEVIEKIANDANPMKAQFNLTRTMMVELRKELQEGNAKQIKEVLSRLEEIDPDYRANKEEIDLLMKEAGISREQAKKTLAIVKARQNTDTDTGKGKRAKIPQTTRSGVSTEEDGGDAVTELPFDMERKLKQMDLPSASEKSARNAMLKEINIRRRK